MSRVLDVLVDDLWIISIDRRGMDVRVRTDGGSLVRRSPSTIDVERLPRYAARAVECALRDDDSPGQNFNHDDEGRDACLSSVTLPEVPLLRR